MSLAPPDGKSILHASQKAHDNLSALSKACEAPGETQDRTATARKQHDELERLDIWITEHDVSSGELDHRLREASHLRDRVLSLLEELSGMLIFLSAATVHQLMKSRSRS
jgi:hypothetical protein